MRQLTPSEKAVVNHINSSGERYSPISTIELATIESAGSKLTKEEIASTISSLKKKGIIDYTWTHEELLYVLYSKLPQ